MLSSQRDIMIAAGRRAGRRSIKVIGIFDERKLHCIRSLKSVFGVEYHGNGLNPVGRKSLANVKLNYFDKNSPPSTGGQTTIALYIE
jgi:hypothetical protein